MEIEWWHYATFILGVLVVLALDLGVFHRRARVVKFREALAWTCLWVSLSLFFAWTLRPTLGPEEAQKFLLGYILELSLSMDNVFVIALIFGYFQVPITLQHRVLFWGILGAFIMRGIMIAFGAALVSRFDWILYVFGFFLLVTGIKMVFTSQEGVHPERNPVVKLARRFFPVTEYFVGQHFIVRHGDRLALTPLALVLLMVETTDLVFAVDSIPAIFGVTQNPFIVFTSNVFAILGLRSLYFVLANLIGYFRYLKLGLSFVLVFIGLKMLMDPHGSGAAAGERDAAWYHVEISTGVSLGVVGGILACSILVSLLGSYWDARRRRSATSEPPS
jgi:tellurite resistance protein TerC